MWKWKYPKIKNNIYLKSHIHKGQNQDWNTESLTSKSTPLTNILSLWKGYFKFLKIHNFKLFAAYIHPVYPF